MASVGPGASNFNWVSLIGNRGPQTGTFLLLFLGHEQEAGSKAEYQHKLTSTWHAGIAVGNFIHHTMIPVPTFKNLNHAKGVSLAVTILCMSQALTL